MSDMQVIDSVNPRSGVATPSRARLSTPEQVDAAADAAKESAASLEAMGREGRALLLETIAAELRLDADSLVDTCVQETGLGEERLRGELERTAAQLEFQAQIAREGSYLNPTIDHATDTATGQTPDLRRMCVPIGPIAAFAASNFPFAFSVAGGDTASALAAGCPVVVKAHSSHPETSVQTFATVQRAVTVSGAPPGIVGMVFGQAAGTRLVEHRAIQAVGFTGSVAGGRALARVAFDRPDPIPFFGELGSVNPFVVTPAAARARGASIAALVVQSFTLGAGQFCTKPGLLFVPSGPAGDAFVSAARKATADSIAGHSLNAAIHQDFHRIMDELEAAPDVVMTVGRPAAEMGSGPGFTVRSLLLETPASEFGADHVREHFGPLAVVVRYDSLDQLTEILRGLPGALVGTVHGELEDDVAREVAAILARSCGRLVWNGVPTGVAVTWAMHHGGPWPSANDSQHSSVGATAIERWVRPLAWQGVPEDLLPAELREGYNSIPRRIDGALRWQGGEASLQHTDGPC